jgi:hypothetical protein
VILKFERGTYQIQRRGATTYIIVEFDSVFTFIQPHYLQTVIHMNDTRHLTYVRLSFVHDFSEIPHKTLCVWGGGGMENADTDTSLALGHGTNV